MRKNEQFSSVQSTPPSIRKREDRNNTKPFLLPSHCVTTHIYLFLPVQAVAKNSRLRGPFMPPLFLWRPMAQREAQMPKMSTAQAQATPEDESIGDMLENLPRSGSGFRLNSP